ncbi:three-helix bundle dimerization domain-containing protein [Nocardia pseudobrasiliensis]|uniref:three-helix bundle dimerization domain-containing protein n=1 Tax=Nocardia pseudobrasiliensis TaxID=45979 RepID=UPI0035A2280C
MWGGFVEHAECVSIARTMSTRTPGARSVIDQAVDRLYVEFDNRVPRRTVREVVRRCVDDLAGSPAAALPELGERLARQRLLETVRADRVGTS